MSVSLSGAVPSGEGNGLAAIEAELVRHPHRKHLIVAIVDTKKITINPDDDSRTPTIRLRRIEPVGAEDVEYLQRLLERAFERRTGQTVLPMELEADVREVLDALEADERKRQRKDGQSKASGERDEPES